MTSDKDKLIVPMGRSSGSISALFILLGLSLATAITAVAVQRWEDHGFDPLEAMAIGVICTVVARMLIADPTGCSMKRAPWPCRSQADASLSAIGNSN